MIQEAIQELFQKATDAAAAKWDLEAKHQVVELSGRPYQVHGSKCTAAHEPAFPQVLTTTLAGLVDAIKLALIPTPSFVSVTEPTQVIAWAAPSGAWKDRHVLATAAVDVNAGAFTWGHWHEADDFVIALQSKFGETEDRQKLVRVLANLSGGVLRTSTDDGISQTVSVKAGVSLLGEEKIVNPVVLRPYRTFSDVEQPTSPFVLRLRQDKDQAPKIALFEADGGLWKRTALDSIHSFLTAANLGVPVLR